MPDAVYDKHLTVSKDYFCVQDTAVALFKRKTTGKFVAMLQNCSIVAMFIAKYIEFRLWRWLNRCKFAAEQYRHKCNTLILKDYCLAYFLLFDR